MLHRQVTELKSVLAELHSLQNGHLPSDGMLHFGSVNVCNYIFEAHLFIVFYTEVFCFKSIPPYRILSVLVSSTVCYHHGVAKNGVWVCHTLPFFCRSCQ